MKFDNRILSSLKSADFDGICKLIEVCERVLSSMNPQTFEREVVKILHLFGVNAKIQKDKKVLALKEAYKTFQINGTNPVTVEKLDKKLSGTNFKTRNQSSITVSSKILWAIEPDYFVPSDKYSRKGLNILTKKQYKVDNHEFQVYFQYFEEALVSFLKEKKVQKIIADWKKKISLKNGNKTRFIERRLLDWYLMKLGGRNL